MTRATENEPSSRYYFYHKTRYLILFLSLICMTLAQVNSVTFNFTVICMEGLILEHQQLNLSGTHWMADPTRKSIVFSGAAIGAVSGLFPAVWMINRIGVRHALTVCGCLSAVASTVFPLAVSVSFPIVVIVRILEGIAGSALLTVITIISGIWSPFSEMGTNLAILSCFFQFSMIICMPISGILCESSFGWPSIYYFFGVTTAIFYVFFFIFYRNDPKFHSRVSRKEAALIEADKIPKNTNQASVPYWSICKDPTILAAWASFCGADVCFLLLIHYGPTYLRKVLDFDVIGAGFASALPYICSILVKVSSGKLSDKMTFVSVKTRFCGFAGVSHLMQAVSLMVMSRTDNRTVAQVAFTVAIASSGMNVMGNVRCIQLRSRQYVHFAMGLMTFVGCFISFLTPLVVGVLCPNNTPEEWSRAFLYASIIVIVFYIPFPIFTSDRPGVYCYPRIVDEPLNFEKL